MSRFSGPQGKGALRRLRAAARRNNFEYGLSIWNDGTGFIVVDKNDPTSSKRVANPLIYLRKAERPEFALKVKDWRDNG